VLWPGANWRADDNGVASKRGNFGGIVVEFPMWLLDMTKGLKSEVAGRLVCSIPTPPPSIGTNTGLPTLVLGSKIGSYL
jgi:hypothetical protein